jgi:hypothetical protein
MAASHTETAIRTQLADTLGVAVVESGSQTDGESS